MHGICEGEFGEGSEREVHTLVTGGSWLSLHS